MKDIHVHGLKNLILLRWEYNPNLSIVSMQSLFNLLNPYFNVFFFFFSRNVKANSQTHLDLQAIPNSQNNLENNNKINAFTLLDF